MPAPRKYLDLELIQELCAQGASDALIARKLGVSAPTIANRKVNDPEVKHAIEVGRLQRQEKLLHVGDQFLDAEKPNVLAWTIMANQPEERGGLGLVNPNQRVDHNVAINITMTETIIGVEGKRPDGEAIEVKAEPVKAKTEIGNEVVNGK